MNHILASETKEEATLCTAVKVPEQEMNSSVSHHSGLNVRQKKKSRKSCSSHKQIDTHQLKPVSLMVLIL